MAGVLCARHSCYACVVTEVEASADQISITCGAQQGIDLVLRTLVGDRDRVAVEAPTYGVAHRLHGARGP
ncbi:MAG: hypothetical protein Q8O67_33850 [Deltaproteobacteria bacterium]|nr:hypothetical protein [Deltaproteobacteria bacterium]